MSPASSPDRPDRHDGHHGHHGEEAHDGHDDDGYRGPARLRTDAGSVDVRVHLAGYFQPLDGHYRWYGRLEPSAELDRLVAEGPEAVELTTPHGSAVGRLGEADLWRRPRVEGVGLPPFPVPTTLDSLPARH